VLFHAAGSDGLGAIAAAKEAGKWAIGCDSDQHHVAPEAVLTSFIKRVDYAVYQAATDVAAKRFTAGHTELGLKEGGVGYSPLGLEKLPNRDALVAQLEGLRKMIVDGTIKVPGTPEELAAFAPPAR
jgi:basic membrane protein A